MFKKAFAILSFGIFAALALPALAGTAHAPTGVHQRDDAVGSPQPQDNCCSGACNCTSNADCGGDGCGTCNKNTGNCG